MGEFLSDVYKLSGLGKSERRRAIALVLDYLDGRQLAGDFQSCDEVFRAADVTRLDESVLVSFLGITLAASHRMPHREDFYAAVLSELARRRGCDIDDPPVEFIKKFRGVAPATDEVTRCSPSP